MTVLRVKIEEVEHHGSADETSEVHGVFFLKVNDFQTARKTVEMALMQAVHAMQIGNQD